MKNYLKNLENINACEKALEWAATQPSPQTAWDSCERGDWMLWLCGRVSGEPGSDARKKLTLAACQCARLTLHLVPEDEHRPEQAICTSEQWALGDASVTLDDVRDAYASSSAASAYAAYYAAAASANAAAYAAAASSNAAAYAADAAAYAAATTAANAAASYAAAAYSASAAAARADTLRKCADIVRKFYPKVPRIP